MNIPKAPLYRKVNTRARNVRHRSGGDARHDRNTKLGLRQGMAKDVRRGLDYTPLFRFLLSKVGEDWDTVHSEAVSRLDRQDPIFWMVALHEDERHDYIRVGESSYYSGLYVDESNKLQVVAPEIGPDTLDPSCSCCTHTFNGKPFTRPYRQPE